MCAEVLIAAVDLGSTSLKFSLFRTVLGRLELVRNHRLRHDFARVWRDPERLSQGLRQSVRWLSAYMTTYRPHRTGFAGFRESALVLDKDCRPLMMGSNLALAESASGIREALTQPAVSIATAAGWLCAQLGGRLAITGSELFALRQFIGSIGANRVAPLAYAGESLGTNGCPNGCDLYLSGSDEQAAHLGQGLGESCDVAIGTGTFWNFTSVGLGSQLLPPFRQIPALDPYPAVDSLIGYRWGAALEQIHSGVKPNVEGPLPDWAFGQFSLWQRQGMPAQDWAKNARDLLVKDIAEAVRLLHGNHRPARIQASGGGSRLHRGLILAALERHNVRFMDEDATARGVAILGGLGER